MKREKQEVDVEGVPWFTDTVGFFSVHARGNEIPFNLYSLVNSKI